MTVIRSFLIAGSVCVLAAGCARGYLSSPPPSASTVTVGPDRTGGTVRLDVGDRLVLDLGANYAVPSGQLPGVSYPHDLLAFSAADVRVGRYVFTGRAKGMAKISVLSPNCRPGPVVGDPGATPAAPAGVRCPLLGPEGGPSPPRSSGGPAIPSWFFTLTVLIS